MAQLPVLDYGARKRSVGGRIVRGLLLSIATIALLLGVLNILTWYHDRDVSSMADENKGFGTLGLIAARMIDERAPGVEESKVSGHWIITSFDALFDYVAGRRPDLVSFRDAPNPFPGLLPPGDYGRRKAGAVRDGDVLIWSKRVYQRPIGKVQCRLSSNGVNHGLLHDSPVVHD